MSQAAISAVGKLFGIRGWFYNIAGYKARSIDGPCDFKNLLFTIPFVGEDTSFDSDSLTVARGEDTFIRHVDELILERPYNHYVVLGPDKPDEAAADISKKVGVPVAITDINDLEGQILGLSMTLVSPLVNSATTLSNAALWFASSSLRTFFSPFHL